VPSACHPQENWHNRVGKIIENLNSFLKLANRNEPTGAVKTAIRIFANLQFPFELICRSWEPQLNQNYGIQSFYFIHSNPCVLYVKTCFGTVRAKRHLSKILTTELSCPCQRKNNKKNIEYLPLSLSQIWFDFESNSGWLPLRIRSLQWMATTAYTQSTVDGYYCIYAVYSGWLPLHIRSLQWMANTAYTQSTLVIIHSFI